MGGLLVPEHDYNADVEFTTSEPITNKVGPSGSGRLKITYGSHEQTFPVKINSLHLLATMEVDCILQVVLENGRDKQE